MSLRSGDIVALLAMASALFSSAAWAQPNLAPYKPSAWSDSIVLSKIQGGRTNAASIAPTDSLFVNWAVANSGSTSTSVRFYTELYVDGVLNATWYIDPPMQGNYYAEVTDYSLGSLPVGTHTLRIETDSTSVVTETNESDNAYTKTIAVTGSSTPSQPGSWVLPSAALRAGQGGAEFHTDVRILNLGTAPVTVTATFYDQSSGATVPTQPLTISARRQASFDNILQSLFARTLATGPYGPIRFDSTGPIVVSSSVNNVNACGTGATSGQWLPGIDATKALAAGAIPQIAVSADGSSGNRTNLVVMNPGTLSATVTVKVRQGGGQLLSTGTIGPLSPNGFSQVALDNAGVFPGVAGRTDSNLWLEYTSDRPVIAFASVINNASGDPFAIVATVANGGESAWSGGGPSGTDVRALAIDPAAPGTLYAGTSDRGVFKSIDSGVTWATANSGLTNLSVNALAVNPALSSMIFAGTSSGLFRSTDGGLAWIKIASGIVDAVAMSPATTPPTLFAGLRGAGNDGVFRSTNLGTSWTSANAGLTSQVVSAFAIDPTASSTIYVAMASWGVYRSTNSGGTWHAANTGLPPSFGNCGSSYYSCPDFFTLAVDRFTPSTLYAGVSGGVLYGSTSLVSGDGGVFKSTNAGSSWFMANAGLNNRTVYAMAISPTSPSTLYVGTSGGGVFTSTDSGATWHSTNEGLTNLKIRALSLDSAGGALYAGLNGGGVWRYSASGSWVLPSSAFRSGVNGAEFRTDVRILNLGTESARVTATFYDQASGTTTTASPFSVTGRSQTSFNNVLQSLFGKTLANASYGPIRFDAIGPIVVSSSVNNVNACGTGATSGQWLPGIDTMSAMAAGAIPHLAVSSSPAAGYRTNLVVMNPGSTGATTTVRVRGVDGTILSSGAIGPLGANGFSQVSLDGAGTFPGMAGRTDANLWVEYTSSQPVLTFASVINNVSGDPFAVLATSDAPPSVPPLNLTGTFTGSNHDGPMSLTLTQTGGALTGHGTFSLPYPYGEIGVSVTGTVDGATVTMAMQWNGGCYYKFPSVSITSATNDFIAGKYSAPLGCSGSFTGGDFLIARQ